MYYLTPLLLLFTCTFSVPVVSFKIFSLPGVVSFKISFLPFSIEIQQIIHVLHRKLIEYWLLIPHTGCFCIVTAILSRYMHMITELLNQWLLGMLLSLTNFTLCVYVCK